MIPTRSQFESLLFGYLVIWLFGCWIDRKAGLSHRKEELGEYRLPQAKEAEDAAPLRVRRPTVLRSCEHTPEAALSLPKQNRQGSRCLTGTRTTGVFGKTTRVWQRFSIFSSQRVHASSGAKADSRPAGFGSGTVPLGGFAFDPNECCIPTDLGSSCLFCSTSWQSDRQGRR